MSSIAVLLSLLLAGQDAPVPQTPSALVGIWEGIQRFEQVGQCGLVGNPTRVKIAVMVDPDGSLRVQQAGAAKELDWTGRIGDGKVVFEAQAQRGVTASPATGCRGTLAPSRPSRAATAG